MKILYVNGIKFDDKISNTYLKLKELLKNDDVQLCKWKYGDNVSKKIDECIERIKPDLIIASSTAGLFVTKYNIPIILINPVIDRKDLEKLFPNLDFSNYPEKAQKNSNVSLILGKNDEVLDYKKALKYFKDNVSTIIVPQGHRLNNLEPIIKKINQIKTELKELYVI